MTYVTLAHPFRAECLQERVDCIFHWYCTGSYDLLD